MRAIYRNIGRQSTEFEWEFILKQDGQDNERCFHHELHEDAVFILISIVAFEIFVVRIYKTFWDNLKEKMIPPGAVNDATYLNDFCFYSVV